MQDLAKVGLLLLLVQVELADGVQGLVSHASHSVHPHLSRQHALPHNKCSSITNHGNARDIDRNNKYSYDNNADDDDDWW